MEEETQGRLAKHAKCSKVRLSGTLRQAGAFCESYVYTHHAILLCNVGMSLILFFWELQKSNCIVESPLLRMAWPVEV